MDIILQVMTTANMFLLLSILILTGGMSFTNLNIVDSVLAKEPVCNLEIQSLLPCTLGSESGDLLLVLPLEPCTNKRKMITIRILTVHQS